MDRKAPFVAGTTSTGTPYYLTGQLPDVNVSEFDQTYKAKAGERFDNIAYKIYGKPIYWWIIAKANGYTHGEFATNEPCILQIPKLSLY